MTSEQAGDERLDLAAIEAAVAATGYPFELEIAQRIESRGYFVSPNYGFEDHDSGKSRELDLHAITAETIAASRYEYLFVTLLGSCKQTRNVFIFFTRPNPLPGLMLSVDPPLAGSPSVIVRPDGERESVADFLRIEDALHVATAPRICSQFAVFEPDSGKHQTGRSWGKQWKPVKENYREDLVIPLIKALDREMAEVREKAQPEQGVDTSSLQIHFPVVILKAPMIEAYAEGGKPAPYQQIHHVVFVRHYQSSTLRGQFAIDFISEAFLEQYLDMVDAEIAKIVGRIRRHRNTILASIQAAIEERQASAALELRGALEGQPST